MLDVLSRVQHYTDPNDNFPTWVLKFDEPRLVSLFPYGELTGQESRCAATTATLLKCMTNRSSLKIHIQLTYNSPAYFNWTDTGWTMLRQSLKSLL